MMDFVEALMVVKEAMGMKHVVPLMWLLLQICDLV